MALFATPEDLMNEYYKLDVPLDDGSVEVKINGYKNNGIKEGRFGTQAALQRALWPLQSKVKAEKDASKRVINGTPIDPDALALTFTGKGMPDDIRLTLRLAVRYGIDGLKKEKLQKFCDDYIGLDCNGFVGNYMLLRGQTYFGNNRRAGAKKADWIAIGEIDRREYRRKSAGEILANDVLIWPGVHIAIINEVYRTGTTVEFDVVESNFKLQMNRYKVQKENKGAVFTVKGYPTGITNVHIVDVDLAWPWDEARVARKAPSAMAAAGVA